MKFSQNLSAGILLSIWSALISLAVIPFYIRHLGIEAYGLIGFYAALQAVFQILDLGLGPTINREVAKGAAVKDLSFARNLLRTLEWVYWMTAAAIAVCVYLLAPLIAGKWLAGNHLPSSTLAEAVALIGLVLAFRWPIGLYQGAIVGREKLALTSSISATILTLGSLGAVLILKYVSATIGAYFLWQAFLGLIQVILLNRFAWRLVGNHMPVRFEFDALKKIWRFSAGMSMVALMGVIFMQLDKVILSKIVSLTELGKYTLAGVAARSLQLFLTPVFNVIYPRLTSLVAKDNSQSVESFYHNGTRALMSVLFPIGFFISIFALDIFYLWTGNYTLSYSIRHVVPFIMLGSTLNGAMVFPYALQLAYGRAGLAAKISAILLFIYVPLVFILSLSFGIVGGAAAWAIFNLCYLLIGAWRTHRIILKGIIWRWLSTDVGIPFAISLFIVAGGGELLLRAGLGPIANVCLGAVLATLAVALNLALVPFVRGYIVAMFIPARTAHF